MSRGRCRRFATIRQLWLAGISLAAVLLVTGASPANSGNGKGNINGAAESKFHRPGCDCNAIPLKPGPPVCGDDGIEYINPCLAECQGVTVVKNGRCPGNSGKPEWVALKSLDSDGVATLKEVQEFVSEGFKMTGRFKPSQAPKNRPVDTPVVFDDREADKSKPDPSDPESFEVRYTPSGDTFVRKVSNGASAIKSSDSSAPGPATTPSRKLLMFPTIIGSDDRVQTSSHAWPYSAVGVVGTHCTGTLIGPHSVLTAGHCVYNIFSRTFLDNLNFRPNSHGGPSHMSGTHHRPTVPWRYVTTMYHNAGLPSSCPDGQCSAFKDWTYDYAVIQLWEDVGNQYGWLGLTYQCGSKALSVRTAGYPGDKPDFPQRMYTTTAVMDPFDGCVENVENGHIKNNLDSAPGQSGSGIWDSNGYVRAILVNSLPGARTITNYTFSKIINWMLYT